MNCVSGVYLLILTLVSNPQGGGGVSAVDICSLSQCESIGTQWVQQNKRLYTTAKYLCLPKT